VVVEIEVTTQSAFGFVQVGVAVQIDFLIFHAAPQSLDEDVVQTAAAPVHTDAYLGLVKPVLVNWLPWSVLNISGVPAARASLSASTENTASSVFESRQDST